MSSAIAAIETGKQNPQDRWVGGENSARDRLLRRICVPAGRQSFRCTPQDSFFAMGSCFARNVEERLELAGATVLSRKMAMRDLGAESARTLGVFNKYNPFSILQELQFASGERDFPEAGFLPAGEGLFYDAQLRSNSGKATLADLQARRAEIRAAFAQAFSADVMVLTLGLIEAWYDNETGLYLTEMPPPRLILQNPARFAFRCLTIDDCRVALAEIRALLGRHAKPGQKFVLTVSPVALARTFTEHDVIVANMTSKSTLRVAAMEFCNSHADVDYFPSYETVQLSDPALAWQDDRLHASDFIVGQIIATFLARYGFDQAAPVAELVAPGASPEQALIARLAADVDKYKNRVLALEKKLETAGG
jgi:hypothetical protein